MLSNKSASGGVINRREVAVTARTGYSVVMILALLLFICSMSTEALPLAAARQRRALDHLEGDDFTLRKRALDVMEGDGFGFEKRALDTLDGDDFIGLKRRRRALDSLDGDGFAGFQKRALDMLEGDSWGGIDKRAGGVELLGMMPKEVDARQLRAVVASQRRPLYGQRLIKTYKRALDALEGNSFGF